MLDLNSKSMIFDFEDSLRKLCTTIELRAAVGATYP